MTGPRALAAAVLIALLAGCGGANHNGGNSQFGAAAPGSSPSPGPTGDSTVSPSPGPTAPSPGPAPSTADLRASYHVDKGLLGAKSTVSVTITNQGGADAQGWTVIMDMSGVTFAVTTAGVNHETRDGHHVFTPSGPGSTLGPGDTFGFSFSVTGFGSISSCTINGRDCTTT